MLRRWNKYLALLLAVVLVFTTLGTDFSSVKAADGEHVEETSETQEEDSELWEKVPEEDQEEDAAEPGESEETNENEESEEDAAESSEEDTETEDATDESTEEAATDESTEEAATDESTEEAATDESSEEAATEDSTEDAATDSTSDDAATEDSTEDAATDSSSDDAASESSSTDDAATDSTSDVVEEKLVTVRYKATLGGQVSTSKETIDINDKDAAFEGSTASAKNKYYQFVAWKDEDGNSVSSESTFVPSDIEADTTFTAEFMKLSLMPAADFAGSAAGMNVTVHADEGIFPEGTTMSVSAVSEAEAVDAAKEALGENVKEAKGVDITFKNADGEEIEPADAKYVHVTISLADELEGESFSVVHKDDDGNATKVAEATSDGADFETNSFSVYIVAGEGEDSDDDEENEKHAIRTYNFYKSTSDKEPFNSQTVLEGEVLHDPGIPDLTKDQEFFGWYYEVDGVRNTPPLGEKVSSIKSKEVFDCYPDIKTTYYVTFYGLGKNGDGIGREVVQVIKKEYRTESDSTIITKDEMPTVTPKLATQAFTGWSITDGGTDEVESVDASKPEHQKLYAVVKSAHWITFDKNGSGASYTAPKYVEYGKTTEAPDKPIRKGYSFDGWFTEAEGGTEFTWGNELKEDITLYAHWKEADSVKYTVILWQQKITDKKDWTGDAKSYDYYASFSETGKPNTEVPESVISKYTGKTFTGFHYSAGDNKYKIVDGNGNKTAVIGIKGDTVVNVYFDRNLMTLKFLDIDDKDYLEPYTGLYGQSLEFNGYSWPDAGADYVWNTSRSGNGSTTTILTDFIFYDGWKGVTKNGTVYTHYHVYKEGQAYVWYYTENLNDSGYTLKDKVSGKFVEFLVNNKYTGFDAIN